MFSISVTSRPRRPEERDGVDYHFVTREAFEELIADGRLLEWAEVHGDLYGTPASNLEQAAAEGRILILDIDVQGARQVRSARPDTVTVFLLPPSPEVWMERLRGRGSEGPEQLRRRLETARDELDAVEDFDFVVVNDRLDRTVEEVATIVSAERRRTGRVGSRVDELRSRLRAAIDEMLA